MRRRTPLLLGSALALVAASPAAAAEYTIGTNESNPLAPVWAPATLNIAVGDTVAWKLESAVSPPLLHDVKSTQVEGTDSWEFQAGPPPAAAEGRRTFTAPGRYQFYCRFHSDGTTGMAGTIVVGSPPPAPPPPPGQTWWPNDSGEPAPLETGGLDTKKPTLKAVRVKRSGKGARISFRVSERAQVTIRFKRGGKTIKTRKVTVSRSGKLTVGGKALRAGRYRIELRATDVAGNTSSLRKARITLR